jgi:hypothetical protein
LVFVVGSFLLAFPTIFYMHYSSPLFMLHQSFFLNVFLPTLALKSLNKIPYDIWGIYRIYILVLRWSCPSYRQFYPLLEHEHSEQCRYWQNRQINNENTFNYLFFLSETEVVRYNSQFLHELLELNAYRLVMSVC